MCVVGVVVDVGSLIPFRLAWLRARSLFCADGGLGPASIFGGSGTSRVDQFLDRLVVLVAVLTEHIPVAHVGGANS